MTVALIMLLAVSWILFAIAVFEMTQRLEKIRIAYNEREMFVLGQIEQHVAALHETEASLERAQAALEDSLQAVETNADTVALISETTDQPTARGRTLETVGDLRVTIDHQAGAISVSRGNHEHSAATEDLGGGFLIDRDDDGRVYAVEVIATTKH